MKQPNSQSFRFDRISSNEYDHYEKRTQAAATIFFYATAMIRAAANGLRMGNEGAKPIQPGRRIAVGLHITKCAGTSLMSTVRRTLPDGRYYICSSYYDNLISGRNLFSHYIKTDDIIFTFGHFVHESLIGYFQNRQLFLFTGLREPIERAISHLSQINDVRRRGSLSLMTAEEYLSASANSMCDEVLRAFPTLAAEIDGSKFEKARSILSMFDYIYNSSDLNAQAENIMSMIDRPGTPLISDNITSKKYLDDEMMNFNRQQSAMLAKLAKGVLADDIRLYSTFTPEFGRPRLYDRLKNVNMALPRERLFRKFPDQVAAKNVFNEWEVGHLVYEFKLLGKLDELSSDLDIRMRQIEKMKAKIAAIKG